MTSRPPARHRVQDDDDDDFLPQAPKRDQNLEKAPAGDGDDFIPRAPKKTKRLKKAQTSSTKLIPDTTPRARANNQDTDMDEIKAAARSSAAASYPGAEAVAGTKQFTGDIESDMTNRSLARHLEASPDTIKSSALGVSALASASVIHRTRATSIGEHNRVKVGAVAVAGPDLSRSTSGTNEDSFDSPPQATDTEQPLHATIVADLVTPNDDIEAQRYTRINTEAKEIADMIQERMFKNAVTPVVQHVEDTHASTINREADIESGHRRKRICILLVAVLAIAGAIGASVGVAVSRKSPPDPTLPPEPTPTPYPPTANPTQPPTPLPSDIDAFRNVLVAVSEVGLDDESSPQYQALNWIANVDPANTTVGTTATETIKQRYVAAVLYFALGGAGWINQYKFLSENDICLWNEDELAGIICNSYSSTPGDVQTLRLSDNGLAGSIPKEIGYFSGLRTVEMTDGAITDKLPSSLAELTLLEELDFTNNALTGTIPDFIYTHAQLMQVRLEVNSLTGMIHPLLGNSPRLEKFLVFQNELTGPIPDAVGQSSVLTFVDLGGNSLTGTIPEFSSSSRIYGLGLSGDGLVGSIPNSIGQLTSLQFFSADNNELTGTIPDLSGNAVLQSLRLHVNKLTGDIGKVFTTTPPNNLVEVIIDGNSVNGTLPSTIGQYTALTSLRLLKNNIRGTIPTEVGLLTALATYFLLDTNQFTGSIPSEIGHLTRLAESLQLSDNNFTGTLPSTLGSLVSLQRMFLDNNALEGPIPTELAQCQNLKILSLEVNQLTGDIGPVINTLPPSLISLEIDTNLLSGTVPTSIGTLTNLDFLDLGFNNLNGTIPTELGLLSNLEVLALNSNQFTGTVPTSLANLPLQNLYLYDNDLTGSLDAFCGIDFVAFTASACASVEIDCACCTHCCDTEPLICNEL